MNTLDKVDAVLFVTKNEEARLIAKTWGYINKYKMLQTASGNIVAVLDSTHYITHRRWQYPILPLKRVRNGYATGTARAWMESETPVLMFCSALEESHECVYVAHRRDNIVEADPIIGACHVD